MNKLQIAGAILILLGVAFYFFVEQEPYITIAGFIAGIGFAVILFGAGISPRIRK